MADIDEDAMPRGETDPGEIDLSDETQDFRFLLSASIDNAKIPKRGEKDFEPHMTALQADTLAASRDAMHAALSHQRVHTSKRHNVAIYHPLTNTAYTDSPKGPLFKSMGRVFGPKDKPLPDVSFNSTRLWLQPEEILYLLDRGTIDVHWPAEDGCDYDADLPMSLQGAFAAFIGLDSELTFEKYAVYSNLKRLGFVVHRTKSQRQVRSHAPTHQRPWYRATTMGLSLDFWRRWMYESRGPGDAAQKQGPLASRPFYRSFNDIYRDLAIIPWHDPRTEAEKQDENIEDEFSIVFDVWKPNNTRYRKSDPGPPDFRIAVVDAHKTSMPTEAQLDRLMRAGLSHLPQENAHMYAKVRTGHNSAVLAIIDQGVISYLRLSDAAFGTEKLYERAGKMQGNKGRRPPQKR